LIALATAITDEEVYERCAAPGFRLAATPDTKIIARAAAGSIFRSYNMLLEEALAEDDLEAVVLIHQDAEIVDPDFIPKVREALRDPDVAIVGCAGSVDVRSIAWWEGSVRWASFPHHFDEDGGGEIPALTFYSGEEHPVFAGLGEVDSIDGFVMAFSPWAMRNLRFDETLGSKLHGYDFDISMQARAAGKKVVVADLKMVHHHSLTVISDIESWIQTHMRLTQKWADQLPVPTPDWEQRARRAEAELSATHASATLSRLVYEMRIEKLEAEIEGYRNSLSWRVTKPLRRLKGNRDA
jgi:hypothetical protein